MSRSRRKNPFIGSTRAESDKCDKKEYHRRMRAMERESIDRYDLDEDDTVFPDERDASNEYDFAKDGKQRFDKKKYPELMRK